MGLIKRELHTNERIGNAIKIFKDITACLEDVLKEPEGAEGLPMTQVCAKHNIDYLNLRKLMEAKTFEMIRRPPRSTQIKLSRHQTSNYRKWIHTKDYFVLCLV